MEIHENIKKIRQSLKLSQKEVANAIPMAQNNYSRLETGKIKIKTERLERLSEIFNIPISEFFLGTNIETDKRDPNPRLAYVEILREENSELKEKMDSLKQQNSELKKRIIELETWMQDKNIILKRIYELEEIIKDKSELINLYKEYTPVNIIQSKNENGEYFHAIIPGEVDPKEFFEKLSHYSIDDLLPNIEKVYESKDGIVKRSNKKKD